METKEEEKSITMNWGLKGIPLTEPDEIRFKYYPPLKSEKLNHFVGLMVSGKAAEAEKWLVAERGLEGHLKKPEEREEFKELAYLNLNPDLCIPSTLSFFENHPEYLFDPDYQILFEMLVFQMGYMEKAVKLEGFQDKLATFITKNMENSIKDNQVQTAAFLARMSRYICHYTDNQKLQDQQMPILKKLLENKSLDLNQKGAVYSEICANLSEKKELDDDDILNLLVGSVYIERHPQPETWTNEYLQKSISESIQRHGERLKNVLLVEDKPYQNLLNFILMEISPDAKEETWEVKVKEGEYPSFTTKTGSFEYYPLLGELIYPGKKAIIPHNITGSDSFKALFPTIQEGLQLGGNVFAFKDAQGIETRVMMKESDLIVDQYRGNPQKWFRYAPKDNFLADLFQGQRYLAGHTHAWRDLGADPPEFLLADPTTHQDTYTCKFNKYQYGFIRLSEVRRLSDGAILGENSKLMKSVEDTTFIHEWYLNGKLVEAELPRSSLRFKTDPKDPSKLHCEQFPGFFLKQGELLNKLGAYRHYLVLENTQGYKKAILPAHHFKPPSKQEVFEPRYSIEMNLNDKISKPQQYHVFEVMKKGTLFSKSREANLYLVETSLLTQNYKQAASILKQHGPKLRAYTPAEVEILMNISRIDTVTGNVEGNALGIQMYAAYLLVKNQKDFPVKGEVIDLKEFARNYKLYHNHLKSVQVLKLSRDEEQYVLRVIPQTKTKGEIKKTSEVTEQVMPAFKSMDPDTLDFTKLLDPWFPWEYQKDLANFKITNLTRLSQKFQSTSKLTALYKLIWTLPDEQLHQYKTGLIFWKHHAKNADDRLKAIFLLLVIDNKGKFPPVPDDLGEKNFKPWWDKVVDTAKEVAKSSPPLQPYTHRIDVPFVKTGKVSEKKVEKISLEPFQLKEFAPFRTDEIVGNSDKAWFSEAQRPTLTDDKKIEKKSINQILEHLLKVSARKDQQPDPLVKKEVERLTGDYAEFQKRPPPPYYTLKENALTEIEKHCNAIAKSQAKGSHNLQIRALEKEIIALARQNPVTSFGIARKELLQWGGIQRKLKLPELIVNFAKQDPTALKARNPALSRADIKALYEKVGTYLQLCTQQQQANRALKTLNELKALKDDPKASKEAIEEGVQKLAADLTAARKYKLEENPAHLVFEYFSDKLLRPQQDKMVSDIIKGSDSSEIRVAIMGSGKTLLLPLLALLRADGNKISTLVVPEALFQSVTSGAQATLRDAFGLSLHTFEFDRNTNFDVETLENILEELKGIKENKEALILTSKSIQCLLLKFVEKAYDHFSESPPKPMTPELKLMREILGLLSNESLPLLDEADYLLSILREVSYSRGKKNGPITQEVDLVTDLYDLVYNDPEIKKLARVESDPSSDRDAPVLTEQLYHDSVKTPLANKFIDSLKTKEFDNKTLQSTVNKFFSSLDTTKRNLVLEYLCRTTGKEKEAQAFYDGQSKEVREILSMAGEEISNLLPHSLLKACDEKYGVDDELEGILAIPFAFANTPSRGSEFSNHHITMNYTLQYYAKKKIPRRIVETQLQLLQESARREIRESLGEKNVKDTEAWKQFCQLKGDLPLPFFNLTSEQIDLIHGEVNKNTGSRLRMVQNFILPQIMIFDSKISANSHNLASFFKVLSGFTGTLMDSASIHRKIKPLPTKGTDALTISKLWENSYDKVHTIKPGTPKEMMERLKATGVQFDMVADAAGYWKENDNNHNARLLSETTGKPSVFYDKNGEQAIWDGLAESPFAESELKDKEEKRATFLDQARTRGADVTQRPLAIGFVTIGPDMDLHGLLQAVWRLRGLDKVQKVEFAILEDVDKIIRQTLKIDGKEPLTFADILGFAILNQAKHEGRDNFKAFHAELNDVEQVAFLEVLLNPKSTPQECAEVVKKLGAAWIKPSYATSDTLYGQIPVEENSNQIREQVREKAIKSAQEKGLSQTKIEEIKTITERYQDCLPPFISTKVGSEDLTQEQQKIAEKESELELLTTGEEGKIELGEINEVDDLKITAPNKFSPELYPVEIRGYAYMDKLPDTKTSLPVFPAKLFLKEYKELEPFQDAFEGIDISLGMLQILDKKELSLSDISFFGPYRKEIKYVMIDEKNNKVTLLNNNEANRRIQKGYKNIYELTTGYVNSTETISEKTAEKLAIIKFLNGESNLSRKDIERLGKWIKAKGVNKMYDLYTKKILQGQLLKTRKYDHSPLQGLFHSLQEQSVSA